MRYFIFILMVCMQSYAISHAYYVSITEINHNKSTNSLEITIKIFVDDLELMLNKKEGKKLNLGEKNEHKYAEKIILDYVLNHFKINVDNQLKVLDYIGKELENNNLYIYMEIKNIEIFNNLEISNTILFETFEDQVNIIHIQNQKQFESFRLVKDKPKEKVFFE